MGEQQASGYSVQVIGLDTCLRVLTKAGAQLHDLDPSRVRLANSLLRGAAKQVAQEFGDEVVAPLVASHGGGIGPAMAETIRPKADRIPIVRIGATNPTGIRNYVSAAKTKRTQGQKGRPKNIPRGDWKGALAWGMEFGPHNRTSPRNPYGRPRTSRGYVLGPRMAALENDLAPRYVPLLAAVFETAGWPVDDRGRI